MMIAGKNENGGAPKSMLEVVNTISRDYGVAYTLVLHREGRLSQFCREKGIAYCIDGHEPIVMAKGSTGVRRLAKLLLRPLYIYKAVNKNKTALAAVEKQVDLSSFDLIHTNSNRDGIGALIAQKHSIPHVWHLREFGEEDYNTVFLPPYNIEFMNRTTTRFVAISKAVAKAWERKGLQKLKIKQIYNGINFSLIQSDPERKPLGDNQLKMVFTGTVCPAKGQNEIIEAIGLLPEEEKKAVSVDFYGEGVAEYISSLKKRAAELGFADQVRFLGHCDDIGSRLKDYAVGVVCSRSEAFGRITPEYMAAGLITLACDTGANPELIHDGETGFLYHRSDYHDFARLIQRVLKMSTEEKSAVSRAAEQYARTHFTAEKNAENIYQLYREITAEH